MIVFHRYKTQHICLGSVNLSNNLQAKPLLLKFYIQEKNRKLQRNLLTLKMHCPIFLFPVYLRYFIVQETRCRQKINVRNVGTFNDLIEPFLF